MPPIIGRSAFRASRPMRSTASASGKSSETAQSSGVLRKEARKNPELYVLFGIMGGIFGVAGYYFTSNPTGSSQEQRVTKVPGSEPWETGKDAKYQYFPHGDTSAPKKDAPSPLNVTIVPNVNLPKELHDQFNKYGKDEYP